MTKRPRYFIRGLMDGVISTLGVVLGAFNPDVAIVVAAGTAGAVANAVSNVVAAFTAEYTGRYQELRKLEQATLSTLEGSIQERTSQRHMYRDATLDGISSLLGGVIPLLPFFVFRNHLALYGSVTISCVIMGLLGLWIGVLTRRSLVFSMIKLVIMTLVTAGICYVIGHFIQQRPLL